MSFETIIGGCIAVIVAGMPAIIALLKIKELHLAVNSRMDKFIAATELQTEDRLTCLTRTRDLLLAENRQLLDQVHELIQYIEILSKANEHARYPDLEIPPCAD
jgi:hypothetical protein